MLDLHFLLDLAFILFTTKILGILTKKVKMPQVVGALIAGIILGPSLLNIVHETEFIAKLSEIGVIVLMFGAGLGTDINELKKAGKASFIIAAIGVIIPLIGGFVIAAFYNNAGNVFNFTNKQLLQNVFMGVILTATSVSITVETLQELGKLSTKSGTAILGAAVIDDVLGIILLTIVTSLTDSNINIFIVLFKIVAFFLLSFVIGIIFFKLFNYISEKHGKKRRIPIIAFAFCLVLSFISEKFFGVADITGAYIAGIIISNTTQSKYVQRRIEILSYMFLSPMFFASVGLKATISVMSLQLTIFTILLLIVSIISKVAGCGLGAKICGYTSDESLKIGIGMISRGEVALIVANLGSQYGLMSEKYFGPIILVVIITTVITPILLKVVYSK